MGEIPTGASSATAPLMALALFFLVGPRRPGESSPLLTPIIGCFLGHKGRQPLLQGWE